MMAVPFKFDTPSPDDIVANGLTSKKNSHGTFAVNDKAVSLKPHTSVNQKIKSQFMCFFFLIV